MYMQNMISGNSILATMLACFTYNEMLHTKRDYRTYHYLECTLRKCKYCN